MSAVSSRLASARRANSSPETPQKVSKYHCAGTFNGKPGRTGDGVRGAPRRGGAK